ncbi:hypothetical protein MATL_G00112110 [Megalops atlanticus]|uniref:Uncharacterized protein n=1 Tax=Megalops atlanticus TaxID=7932 RepID=A0A9D3T6U1_MEGAT|nr:hypothetical protein MATL_G00112110 [Megalops atlanticus]
MDSDLGTANDLSCPACSYVLRDPVTIPCGHIFCMECITNYWECDAVCSCPKCGMTFAQRPALTVGLAASPPGHLYARPGDILCDICSVRKFRAVKTCLRCLASYCRPHLQTHLDTPALRRHELVNPTGQVQGKICPRHNRVLEVYCYTDQACICSLCVMDEHRNHDIVSAAARREEKQSQLEAMKLRSEEIIQQREEDLQEMEKSIDSFMESAQAAEEGCDAVFRQLIHSIQNERLEVKEQIRQQVETEDHIRFLQRWPSLRDSFQDFLSRNTIPPLPSFELTMTALTRLRECTENMCKEESEKISKAVREVHMFKGPDTRLKPNKPLRRSNTEIWQTMPRHQGQLAKFTKNPVIQREELLKYS